jgi:multisubunit Na+/H+ antiporter MnhE subunit
MKWVEKVFPFLFLVAVFLRAFIKSNLSVAYIVLFVRRSQIYSEIASYDISDLSHFEVLVLAQMITLTPGTIAACIDEGYSEIKIHVLTARGLSNNSVSCIETGLKTALLRLTR